MHSSVMMVAFNQTCIKVMQKYFTFIKKSWVLGSDIYGCESSVRLLKGL